MLDAIVEKWIRTSGMSRLDYEDRLADDGVHGDAELRFEQDLAYLQLDADRRALKPFMEYSRGRSILIPFFIAYGKRLTENHHSHSFREADTCWHGIVGYLTFGFGLPVPSRIDLRDYEEHFRAHADLLLPWYVREPSEESSVVTEMRPDTM